MKLLLDNPLHHVTAVILFGGQPRNSSGTLATDIFIPIEDKWIEGPNMPGSMGRVSVFFSFQLNQEV